MTATASTRPVIVREFNKYWAVFKIQVSNSFAYPLDLLSRSVNIILFMWVFAQLWRTTYASAGESSFAGLTFRDTMWYLLLAEVIMLSKPRISTAVAQSVRDGSIAYLLNKPYNFILYQFSYSLGDSLLRLVSNALVGGVVVWWLVGPPPPVGSWPLTILTIFAALAIDFCLNAMIGLLAFLTEDIAAFEWIYAKFVLIMGGVLIPLDFFPDWLKSISMALPFAATTYGPARFFIQPELSRFYTLILQQGLWLLLLGSLLALMYRKAAKWLTINGG